LISTTQASQMAFLFSHSFRLQKYPKVKKEKRQEACLFYQIHKKSRQEFNKNALARTIEGQEQRFRRLLHIFWMPNGKTAPWHSPSMLREGQGCEINKNRMINDNKGSIFQ
jgi:hypothetical protein